MKKEWKREDKAYYLPKNRPELIEIPLFQYYTIRGTGNPNDPFFGGYISTLYSLSYAIKMSPKQKREPANYIDYTVYPLEGVWSLTEDGIRNYNGILDKNQLSFTLMIRQPDFVTDLYAKDTIERIKIKKPNKLLDEVRFERIEEGKCIQMMHIGSYDAESASFQAMEAFAKDMSLKRVGHIHKEIYISDPGRVAEEKMKTVLRFRVE